MESALRLRCYTLPRTPLPLRIPSSFHAANLQFSSRHSSFSAGKGSRSYPARPILGPIACAVGGFRTPSRHQKANDHNMAKRVGRASFTLACVIGFISCSFWLKQEVIAAPEVGKGSSERESTAREGVSMKPDSATKANPQCKCLKNRRVAVQMEPEWNTNANLRKPKSEVLDPVSQALDEVEDLPQSKLVPQQASSPPQGGVQASSSSVSRESLFPENKAEEHLKPELQGKTSDVNVSQVVAKVEDLPQSQLVPQQASSTVSKKSLLSEDRAEKRLKPEAQEELQGKSSDEKVNSSSSATHFSPSQTPHIDSGVGAVTPFNMGSLPSPLVSITLKVDPSTMPSLIFVSPSTIMPVEPRLGRSKSDRDDGTKVLVRGVPVSPSIAPMVEQIFVEHGDITANCLLKDQAFRAYLVEGLVTVMQVLQEYPERKLTNDDFTFMFRKLEDLERVKVNVGWLREQIEAFGPFLNVEESRRKWETMVAEVGKMGAKLAEQEVMLAQHEGALAQKHKDKAEFETQGTKDLMKEDKPVYAGALHNQGYEGALAQKHTDKAEFETQATKDLMKEDKPIYAGALHNQGYEEALAQKHTDKAEFETQGTKDLMKEDKPVYAGALHNLGILLHAFGFGSLFYLFFMPK